VGFTPAQLKTYEGSTVPDLMAPGLKLLFVGINPGLWTAATQTHFCHPSNRFYPALRRAGLFDIEFDANIGMADHERSAFLARGMGITNLVARATARASEVPPDELRAGGNRLLNTVDRLHPAVVAIAGVTAFRTAFDQPAARMGRQPSNLTGVETWVIPNPSGLNAHETIDSLADWLADVGKAAGLL
jgi:TDG/mug DNA glycosylase family protein